jgi:hypothetical protein
LTLGSGAPPAADPLAQTQQQIRQLAEEVIRLSVMELAPGEYYIELLKRALQGLAAPAGTIWTKTAQGHFQQQCKLNPGQIETDLAEADRAGHEELLRRVIQQARPLYRPPRQTHDDTEAGGNTIGSLDAWAILLAPILWDGQVEAVIEVWQRPQRDPQAVPGLMQFLVRMADLAAVYLLRHQQQQQATDQELWARLDAFAQRIHGSLVLTEVSYLIANEGRQLVNGDRLSVAVRRGRSTSIEAISGVDWVDRRSNLVRLMRRLCDRVMNWGEILVYRGVPDNSLPPDVLHDLDAYLDESHSKVLILMPLRESREKAPAIARSALLLESFATTQSVEQQLGRLDVVGRHTASALFNAVAYRQIPLRFLWLPLARLQSGLGGKTRAILAGVAAALVLLVAALIFVPYPLKMDAKGQLLPEQRRWIYAPVEGQVVRFEEGVEPGSQVAENQSLVLLYDVQLETKLVQLTHEIAATQQDIEALTKQFNAAINEPDRLRISADKKQKESLRDRKFWELRALRERTHADEARPGHFWLKAPTSGTILNWDFRETLTNRQVKPSEPLLRIGDKGKRWEVELKIPQKHMGQIIQAFQRFGPQAELDVDLLVTSAPTQTFRGKLTRTKLAGEASANKEETTESEPVVLASVRIDGRDLPVDEQVPPDLLVAGTEVHAKVRCGNHAMGYSLFYGLWEYFYEKVIFFF